MKIKDISKPAERVDPDEVAKALGAEKISNVEKLIKKKIAEAVERTAPNMERFYLIRWVLISALMQGLIVDWDYDMTPDEFIFEIYLSKPILRTRVAVPRETW